MGAIDWGMAVAPTFAFASDSASGDSDYSGDAGVLASGFFLEDDGISASALSDDGEFVRVEMEVARRRSSSHGGNGRCVSGFCSLPVRVSVRESFPGGGDSPAARRRKQQGCRTHRLKLHGMYGFVSAEGRDVAVRQRWDDEHHSLVLELGGGGRCSESEPTAVSEADLVVAVDLTLHYVSPGAEAEVSTANTTPGVSGNTTAGLFGAWKHAVQAKQLLDDANVPYGVSDRGALADACNRGSSEWLYLVEDAARAAAESATTSGESFVKNAAAFWTSLRTGLAQVEALAAPGVVSHERKVKAVMLLRAAVAIGEGSSKQTVDVQSFARVDLGLGNPGDPGRGPVGGETMILA